MFEWNDTIAKMNKNESLKRLLNKLSDKNATVILYNTNISISLHMLIIQNTLNTFIDNYGVDMLHIVTPKGNWDCYLNDYGTFRFNNTKNTVTLLFYDKDSIEIQF